MSPTNKPRGVADYRIPIGVALIVMIAIGFWLLSPMIIYDLGRMFWWAKILFWIGDLTAIVFVLRWMSQPEEPSELIDDLPRSRDSPVEFSESSLSSRTVGVVLILSLLLDMGTTAATLYSNHLGKQRAQIATANVLSVRESSFREALHYRINISYADPKTVYLLPVAIYAAALLFMGLAIHHP